MTRSDLKTRQTLIERLRDREDKETWREFFDRYWKLIYGLAIKSGLSHDEAEEVVQETMVTISNCLDEYRYQPEKCSFRSWIFHKAKWRIFDQIRKRKPGFVQAREPGSDPNRTATVERVPDEEALKLEQHWNEEWQKNLVDVAMERVKRMVADKQFQIFDLYVLKEWSVTDVKRMLHVSTAQVYLAKHRVSSLIKKEIKKLEMEMG
ncbi:MAG: sigma-70 family RNA polymerase sigma factor [Verrucomicrobiales bacterium]|nr:sigma-70 family RNA polymerase sigma factor [Verrucomicrobiales bacterium]